MALQWLHSMNSGLLIDLCINPDYLWLGPSQTECKWVHILISGFLRSRQNFRHLVMQLNCKGDENALAAFENSERVGKSSKGKKNMSISRVVKCEKFLWMLTAPALQTWKVQNTHFIIQINSTLYAWYFSVVEPYSTPEVISLLKIKLHCSKITKVHLMFFQNSQVFNMNLRIKKKKKKLHICLKR